MSIDGDADVIEKRGVVGAGAERADRRRVERRLPFARRRLFARTLEPAVVERLRLRLPAASICASSWTNGVSECTALLLKFNPPAPASRLT